MISAPGAAAGAEAFLAGAGAGAACTVRHFHTGASTLAWGQTQIFQGAASYRTLISYLRICNFFCPLTQIREDHVIMIGLARRTINRHLACMIHPWTVTDIDVTDKGGCNILWELYTLRWKDIRPINPRAPSVTPSSFGANAGSRKLKIVNILTHRNTLTCERERSGNCEDEEARDERSRHWKGHLRWGCVVWYTKEVVTLLI